MLRAVLAAKATPAPVRQRLSVGAREYGTSSDRPVPETLDQIAEELADVCGLSVVAFARIEALKARAEILDATHAPAPDAARPSTSRSRSGSGT